MRNEKKKPVKQKVKKCGDCKFSYRFTCCNAKNNEKVGKTVMPWSKACRYYTDEK